MEVSDLKKPERARRPIRLPGFIRFIAELILVELLHLYILVTGWTSRRIFEGPAPLDGLRKNDHRRLFAFWHNRIFYFTYLYRGLGVAVPISLHRDGRLIARVARLLGHRVLDGSSSRGGAAALSGLISTLQSDRFAAITPDGPRGPKYSLHEDGLFYAALRTGAPVTAAAWYAKNLVEFKSWDGFLLPLPFTTFQVIMAEDLFIRSEEEIPAAREELKRRLDLVTSRSERLLREKVRP